MCYSVFILVKFITKKTYLIYVGMEISGGSMVKNLPANVRDAGDVVSDLGMEDPLANVIVTHSSSLAF